VAAAYCLLIGAAFDDWLRPLGAVEDKYLYFFAAGHLGIGLLIRRWRVAALALLIAPMTVFSDSGEPIVAFLAWIFGIPTAAATLAIGVAIGKALTQRAPAARRWLAPVPLAGTVLVAVGVLPFALAGYRRAWPRDVSPAHPIMVDELRAAYERVRFGDPASRVRRLFGRPGGDPGNSSPLGSDFYADGGPSTWRPPGRQARDGALRYRGRAFLASDDRIYGFVITDRRAQTNKGVGIGDSLKIAKRLYPQMRCDVVNEGTEYTAFPACRGRIAPNRYLGFGQDPIRTITLMSVPFS
jgi:hypothetical protein